MSKTEQELYEDACDLLGKEKAGKLLTSLGMGPDYIPPKRKTHKCPDCANNNAYYKEIHPDTDMNEIILYCPDCKHRG